jgi:hypothetical protein
MCNGRRLRRQRQQFHFQHWPNIQPAPTALTSETLKPLKL